jgi:hypothetical protein
MAFCILSVQDAILPRRTVQVQRGNAGAELEAWDSSPLTCGWVTDAEFGAKERKEEEAVARGMDPEVTVVFEPEKRTAAPEDWQTAALRAVEREQRERRLAPMVSVEEIGGGGEAAPGAADQAAAENILGRKADKYLPHQDLLREGGSEGGEGGHAAAARPRHCSSRGFRAGGCRVFE